MSSEPHADAGTDDQFVDLIAARLDRFVARPRDETVTSAETEPAVPAVVGALLTELRAETTWSGPPPGLRESILARARAQPVAAELPAPVAAVATEPTAAPAAEPTAPVAPTAPEPTAAEPVAAGPTDAAPAMPEPDPPAPEGLAPTPAASPGQPGRGVRRWQPGRWRSRFGRLTWALPIAVVGAAAFTALVLGVDRWLAPDPPRAEVFVATGTDLAPGSTAEVSVVDTPAGSSIVLEPSGLPAAAPGSYYAAWLKGPRGSVPIGSFHERRTGVPIELWSGVDIEAYPTLTVTLQAEGAPPTPSGIVVMTASLLR
ncbi:anti-sigma factor domain-containing protein [Micromonospora sp. NPDC048898]|uniref:anti-sigma factor domain-containing protein n=1 Tax=Micromonospora sp. NPDC048898 TaxID=3364260 RepID=UPI0037228CCE